MFAIVRGELAPVALTAFLTAKTVHLYTRVFNPRFSQYSHTEADDERVVDALGTSHNLEAELTEFAVPAALGIVVTEVGPVVVGHHRLGECLHPFA